MIVSRSATFTATCSGFKTGLVGTIGVRVVQGGSEITARTTSGIGEYPDDSGVYYATLTAPSTPGNYLIVWDKGTVTPGSVAAEDLTVE